MKTNFEIFQPIFDLDFELQGIRVGDNGIVFFDFKGHGTIFSIQTVAPEYSKNWGQFWVDHKYQDIAGICTYLKEMYNIREIEKINIDGLNYDLEKVLERISELEPLGDC